MRELTSLAESDRKIALDRRTLTLQLHHGRSVVALLVPWLFAQGFGEPRP